MDYKINSQEREHLRGLPYLHQLLYLVALRPFMDYRTGVVGIKRRVSYQSLAEELYIEPHTGYKGGSPHKNQIRRALTRLCQAGLLESQNQGKRLTFQCVLASQDSSVENQLGIKPAQQVGTKPLHLTAIKSADYQDHPRKVGIPQDAQAGTPPVSGNSYIFLQQQFDIFWSRYPQKKSKSQAWRVFCELNPDETLMKQILQGLEQHLDFYQHQQACGSWVPAWKYPANWLAQRCWQEALNIEKAITGEKRHAKRSIDVIWESCKDGFTQIQAERQGH